MKHRETAARLGLVTIDQMIVALSHACIVDPPGIAAIRLS